MEPSWSDGPVTVYSGDCRDVLAAMEPGSVDAVVCDPPYGLEFMGREWDSFGKAPTGGASFTEDGMGKGFKALPSFTGSPNPSCRNCGGTQRGNDRKGFKRCRCQNPDFPNSGLKQMRAYQDWCEAWAAECFRLLKPGGHLLAFGGTRTYHRLVCGVEDAGFEIRDSLHWIYGSGFPKSHDVSKAIDKAAGAEREVIGPKPRPDGSAPRVNVRAAKFDGTTYASDKYTLAMSGNDAMHTAPATEDAAHWEGWGTALKPAHEPIVMARKPLAGTVAANVLAHGTGAINVDGCRVAHASDADRAESEGKNRHADFGSGPREHNGVYQGQPAADRAQYDGSAGRWPPNILLTHGDCNGSCAPGCPVAEMDAQSGITKSSGGINGGKLGARVFGKFANETIGQNAGGLGDTGGASRFFPCFRYEAKAPARERPRLPDGTAWPTVKPLNLMRWLVRLVTPPGGTVLDPFAGTGTTGEAAALEGFRCVLIERDPVALELIRTRLGKPVPAGQDALF